MEIISADIHTFDMFQLSNGKVSYLPQLQYKLGASSYKHFPCQGQANRYGLGHIPQFD